ncbi:hypothetical protein N864_23945 [Intrasporangium chromatireducens Q5-1]|uniref:Uncharacterized protein n=1 Tax=Intrasporangium chromatireducens Q5-1 TaxID=584657 RepID=W9GG29_9MICO|nr:hypothetical protein N864_23945 [Intrasporangium chromatireducens Q5-1]
MILAGITVATATELESTLAVKYAFSPSLLPVRLHPFLPSSFFSSMESTVVPEPLMARVINLVGEMMSLVMSSAMAPDAPAITTAAVAPHAKIDLSLVLKAFPSRYYF